ncbi:unnamed protein product [Staurois parvus]|uniref:Uncharacterized protein n=1 Tax=Staurois parvus TaxID=386267 RepID=A0ABN9ERP4_9NEOB|nr:unnamed protein product [Staurois parvus]
MGPLCPCPNSKKPMKKVPGASHGPPTDPGPSGSARVSKCQSAPDPEAAACNEPQMNVYQYEKLNLLRCHAIIVKKI